MVEVVNILQISIHTYFLRRITEAKFEEFQCGIFCQAQALKLGEVDSLIN